MAQQGPLLQAGQLFKPPNPRYRSSQASEGGRVKLHFRPVPGP